MGKHSLRVGTHSIFSPMSKLLFSQKPSTDKVLAETDYIEKGGSKDVQVTFGPHLAVTSDLESNDSFVDEDGKVKFTRTNNHGLNVTEQYTSGN